MEIDDKPDDVVRQFLSEMKRWEAEAVRASKKLASGEMQKVDEEAVRFNLLKPIFSRFVIDIVPDDRLRFHPNGRPPVFMHDPDIDVIVDTRIEGEDAWVTTERRRGTAPLILIYHLRKYGVTWKLRDDRCRIALDGRKTPYDL